MPALTTYPALEYTGWGETVASGSDVGVLNQPFQYDGRDGVQADTTLGMNWMRARHYSPTQAQFVQADPLPAQPGTADTAYSYAGNDPVNITDPDGRCPVFNQDSRWLCYQDPLLDVLLHEWVILPNNWVRANYLVSDHGHDRHISIEIFNNDAGYWVVSPGGQF